MTPLEDAVLVLKLIAGIQAIQPDPLPLSRAAAYARAAAYHGARRGVDPFELVALARHESDFREQAEGPDHLDCGLTQTRVLYSRYSCDELKRSPWLAFGEAAREMAQNQLACAGHADFDRCRLNRYNSGGRYARRGFHGRYYLRVGCFAEAARRQVPTVQHCRDLRSERELALLFPSPATPAAPAAPATAVSVLLPGAAAPRPPLDRYVAPPPQDEPEWLDRPERRDRLARPGRHLPPPWAERLQTFGGFGRPALYLASAGPPLLRRASLRRPSAAEPMERLE